MSIWSKQEIFAGLRSFEPSLCIQPLLSDDQVNDTTVDLRLGYDFLVSILTRNACIDISGNAAAGNTDLSSHFQETRREMGAPFVLYPNQLVLVTTLEYISLPADTYADIFPRSSYSKLGVALGGMLQPGYRGCIPLELLNHGNVPVTLTVGTRICQMRLMRCGLSFNYHSQVDPRKYFAQVRPSVSKASTDSDIAKLRALPRMLDL
ncbi:dCTP deaminase [Massilia aurea]|uniref:dCTP deaminase n=1 Tax=Massilia aurea TaxID=373040 RepID=UPI00346342D4